MTTYDLCVKLIAKKKGDLGFGTTEYNNWKKEMKGKLDVFLLANRIEEPQYRELVNLLDNNE